MNNKLWILMAAALLLPACQQGPATGPAEAQDGPAEPPMEVTEFVHQIYIEGIPYEEADRYDSSAVPALVAMLSNPEEEAYWANVVNVLGIIGDEQCVAAMIDFVGQGSAEETLSAAHLRAKTSAVMSLGYAVHKTGNRQALDYLKSWLEPSARVEGLVAWASPIHDTQARDAQLSKMAILGLALSGNAEAGEALRAMQQQPEAAGPEGEFQAAVSDMLSEALDAHTTIAEEGLGEYYRKSKLQ